jgi:hypothetical protein
MNVAQPPFYILHYKKNCARREYLEGALGQAGMAYEWMLDHDAGEFDVREHYEFDANQYCLMTDVIKEVMFGYALGLTGPYSGIPWAMCVAKVTQAGLTLGQLQDRAAWLRPKALTPGEVSLFMKHRAVWERIAADSAPFAIVAEDDIILGPNTPAYLGHMLSTRPDDADYIDLAGGCNLRPRAGNAVRNSMFFMMQPPRDRTTCCALVSRRLAREIVALKPSICLPVDWALTYFFTLLQSRVYWLEPPLFGHGSEMKVYPNSLR